jgi:hypothetical protein
MPTSPQSQKLLIAAAVLVVVVLFFLAAFVKRRSSRGAPGDFASLLAKENVQAAAQVQGTSSEHDASAALEDTKSALRTVTAYGRRIVNLAWALFAGFFCLVCTVFVLVSFTSPEGPSWGSTAFFFALGGLAGWFSRVQWRSFRAPNSAHLRAMDEERWFLRWLEHFRK